MNYQTVNSIYLSICVGFVLSEGAWAAPQRAIDPLIIEPTLNANTSIATDILSITLGSGNYNLPAWGNSGKGLMIGENNHLSTPLTHEAGYGIVLGFNNDVRTHAGIVAGYQNKLSSGETVSSNFGKFTSIFGISNIVYPGNSGSYASMVVGSNQKLTGDYSFLSGQTNTVNGGSLTSESINSVAMGVHNTIAASTGWTIGAENIVIGKEGTAFGKGLKSNWRGAVVLGTYNQEPTVTGTGSISNYVVDAPLLIVGNGDAVDSRSNGLVLRRSGDLEIAGQIYSNGNKVATESYAVGIAGSAITSALHGSVSMSGGTVDGSFGNSIAGSNSTASYGSTAFSSSIASGYNSVALAQGNATASAAIGMANGYAAGFCSVAMAAGRTEAANSVALSSSTTYGYTSTAMSNATTWGSLCVAAGLHSEAISFASFAAGSGGTTAGEDSTGWVETDSIFAIGNTPMYSDSWFGEGPYTSGVRSNAITTLKNGQTKLTNRFWNSDSPKDIPINVEESSEGNALVVEGHTVLRGNTKLEGKVTIAIPQGDISMGIYGAE